MKNKGKTIKAVIFITMLSTTIVFAASLYAQGVAGNATNSGDKPAVAEQKPELVNGSWILTDRSTYVANNSGVTLWSGAEDNLLASCRWSISSMWNTP